MIRLKKGFTFIVGLGFLALGIYFFYLEWKDLSGDLGIKQLLFDGWHMIIGFISVILGYVLMSSIFKKVKKLYLLIFVLVSLFSIKSQAQHCPFDGTSIIMLKIKGDKKEVSNITLREINNPKVDSCRFENELINVVFQPIDSLYARNHWVKSRENRPNMLIEKGDLYVTLNMAQVDCMIPKGNEYTHRKRHFTLSYQVVKTGKTVEMDVPDNRIFSLCTSYGEWKRIKAIVLK
jgi:hypothetical protein